MYTTEKVLNDIALLYMASRQALPEPYNTTLMERKILTPTLTSPTMKGSVGSLIISLNVGLNLLDELFPLFSVLEYW